MPDREPDNPQRFLVDPDPGQPCVYAIRCGVNGRLYIGSTGNLTQRALTHKRKLTTGIHVNPGLQQDWNTYGEAHFHVKVLKVYRAKRAAAGAELSFIREIAHRNPQRLYNVLGNPES